MGTSHILKVNIVEIVNQNLNLMNHAGARVNKPMCFWICSSTDISVYKDLAYITAFMRVKRFFPRNENIKTKVKYIK